MATRLDNDAAAAGHWASLSKSRGVPEVVAPLESIGAALEEAVANAEIAIELLFDAQERILKESHEEE
jgi:predicted RNase H-like HicB family nuclease